MKCIECINIDSKSSEEWIKLGFGKCRKEKEIGRMVSVFCDAECDDFNIITQENIEKRIQWRDKKWPMKEEK